MKHIMSSYKTVSLTYLFLTLACVPAALFGQELTVDEVTPQSVVQGEKIMLKLLGTGFHEDGSVQISDAEGVEVRVDNAVRDGLARFIVAVDADARPGWRSVEWTNPDGGSIVLDLAFQVVDDSDGPTPNDTPPPPDDAPPPPDDTPPPPDDTPPPPTSDSGVPFGIYSLDQPMDLPYVDGVAIRTLWSEVEREEGRYDFSDIERALSLAVEYGQSVTLANMVFDAPAWLNSRAQTFTDGDGRRKIVPWDPDMLAALERLAQAQANFEVGGIPLRDHPNVRQINASIGGISSLRMTNLPSSYSAQSLTDAVFRSLHAWADAYPTGKHLYVGMFVVNDGVNNPSTAEVIRDQVLAEFNGRDNPRINLFQENLTGIQPIAEGSLGELLIDVQDQTGIMMQACGSWTEQNGFFSQCTWIEPVDTPDDGFSHAVNTLGATYFEIYSADLDNPAYTSDFQRWWSIIQQFGE